MKFLALVAIIGAIAASCAATKQFSEDVLPSETKEDGTLAKRGIPYYGHGYGLGNAYEHNNGWGWGQGHGYGHNNGWGNNYVSDYGFKIGQAHGHGNGWGWGWTGQSFAHFNPGWTSHGHGHGHGNSHGHGHHGHKH